MAIHKLTTRKVETSTQGKYEDGGGLRLVVSSKGSKKWVLRFSMTGKRREMGLGSFPEIGLAEARDKSLKYRKQVLSGFDPIELRKNKTKETPTFNDCAGRYIRSHRRSWSNYKHSQQWVRTIKNYVSPEIGKKKVNTILTQDILNILQPIWYKKTETAKRIQGRIETILDYAAAHKFCDSINPARWKGHLDKLLSKPSRVKKVKHHPAMPYSELSEFMLKLTEKQSISSFALQFLILTATRTSEVLNSKWDEINLESSTWTIPAERMKANQEHRIPLSDFAMKILETQHIIEGNPYIFPGERYGRPLSNMALLQLMRGLGYGLTGTRGDYVPHGFRSSFRDWSGEVSSFPRDVAEMALAHVIENKVEAAYRRGDLFLKRRAMMQAWADYISTS